MKQKNKNEVIEVVAEEIPVEEKLETEIKTTLVKANVTDQVIAQLKETYGGMKLKSLDDKEGYLDIKEARKEVRKVGILTEKICKHGREDAVRIQKMWLDKQGEILAKIAEVQDPLDAEIKKFEDEEERKEKAEQERKEAVYINRQALLSKLGAAYDNGSFVSKEISYEVSVIKEADDEMWEGLILPKYQRIFDEVEAERVAEEAKRKEEFERQQKEQKEFEQKQAAFRKEQEEFEKQKAEMQRQKDEEARQKVQAEQKERQEKINERYEQLRSLGMHYDGQHGCFVFEDVNVDNNTEIGLLDDEKWTELVNKITPVIEKRKEQKALSEKREEIFKTRYAQLALLSIEPEIGLDLSSFTDEEWAVKYSEYKKSYDAEKQKEWEAQQVLKKQLEDEQKQKELDAANDKTKYEDVVRYLKATPIHEMRSSIYKSKMNAIRDFIADLN